MSIVLSCACCALTAVSVPAALYVTRPPDGMQVSLTQSEMAQVNQLFFIELDISNNGNEPFSVNRVFLQMPGFPSMMEMLSFISSDPPSALQTISNSLYLDFDQVLNPNESKRLTFYFLPTHPGEFHGSIYILSGSHMWIQDVTLQVVEP